MAARDFLYNMPPRINRKPRVFRGPNLVGLDNNELQKRYRFGRAGVDFLTNHLKDDLSRGTRKQTALTVEQQVLIALRFYASGSFLQVVGDTLGFDKSTVSRVVDDVTNALVSRKGDFIKWPLTNEEKCDVKDGFYGNANFPNVLGCIDCTHVRIQGPSEDEPAFVNRKGFHSINVQAVCDHEGKFTNINANWPGSVHDSHIFNTSSLCDYLENHHRGLMDGVLLGDSGYACRPFLMTPYTNPVDPSQIRYNRSHGSTRLSIERCFGVWKRRFHVLHSEIRMKPEKVC